MGWYPDTKDGNVDHGDEHSGTPFHPPDCLWTLCDDSNSVDDDLHQELDLKDPEEENEEEHWNTGKELVLFCWIPSTMDKRWSQCPL